MIGTNFGIYRPNSGDNNPTPSTSAGNAPAAKLTVSNGAASSTAQVAKSTTMGTSGEERPVIPQLSDFMLQLEDCVPAIPDAACYLNSGGFEANDMRIVRLISLATQKCISDIAVNALQVCKVRTHNQNVNNTPAGSSKPKDRKHTLIVEDLKVAIGDCGMDVRKPDYFQ